MSLYSTSKIGPYPPSGCMDAGMASRGVSSWVLVRLAEMLEGGGSLSEAKRGTHPPPLSKKAGPPSPLVLDKRGSHPPSNHNHEARHRWTRINNLLHHPTAPKFPVPSANTQPIKKTGPPPKNKISRRATPKIFFKKIRPPPIIFSKKSDPQQIKKIAGPPFFRKIVSDPLLNWRVPVWTIVRKKWAPPQLFFRKNRTPHK